MEKVLCIILGGGRGTRLYPLTKHRSKPAVPLGGKYRLIDITISNAINSGMRDIFVLTQFNSASLNTHISQTYRFDTFTNGFVEILAAEQTAESSHWYQGTADAIRKQMRRFDKTRYDHILILSGDHLYRMNYRNFIRHHLISDSDITLSTVPIKDSDAPHFGIMKINEHLKITEFVEKPSEKDIIQGLYMPESIKTRISTKSQKDHNLLASMGIYVFKRNILKELLNDERRIDFGKDIIPYAIKHKKVFAYPFKDYWEDIGSINSFFNANIHLTYEEPNFFFYKDNWPIYCRPKILPSSKVYSSNIDSCIISDGCLIKDSTVKSSILGQRSIINSNCHLERVVFMGSDYYELDEEMKNKEEASIPKIGIGENCIIKNAIIDKCVSIGNNVKILNKNNIQEIEDPLYHIKDGIVIIPKGTIIPDNTEI